MRKILSNTTAIAACLSLSLPGPGLAQEAVTEEPAVCADGSEPPCPEAEDSGETVMEEPAEGVEEAAPEAAEEAQPVEEAPQDQADSDVPDAVDTSPAPEDAVEVEPEVESEADIATDPTNMTDEEPAATGAEPAQEPAQEPAVDAASEGDAEAGSEDELRRVLEDDAAVPADAAEPATETAEEPASGAAPAEEGEPEASEQDELRRALQEEQADPEAEATGEAEAEADAEATTAADSEALAEEQAATEDEVVAAEAAAATAASAAALSADDAAGADVEVTEETVTEETSRQSDEDFSSQLDAAAAADDDDDDDDDRDRTRDMLIGGALGALGGFVVGQMIGDREVVATADDRIVVQRDGNYQVLKDDNALLRRPGSDVRTETFSDGSSRTIVTRDDGSQVVTIRDADLRVIRRSRILPDGTEIRLIDDTIETSGLNLQEIQRPAQRQADVDVTDTEALRRALADAQRPDRRFTLSQVREVRAVRDLAPAIQLDNITFETGSAAIRPDQAQQLNDLGRLISQMIEENPREIFLIEGHTDAVGDAAYNLALSDRRAESVALALTEYFDVPPENLVVQGYGERYLRVQTEAAERLNRRASVRRITELLQVASAG